MQKAAIKAKPAFVEGAGAMPEYSFWAIPNCELGFTIASNDSCRTSCIRLRLLIDICHAIFYLENILVFTQENSDYQWYLSALVFLRWRDYLKDGPSENNNYGRVAFPRGPATGRGWSIHNVDQIQGGGGNRRTWSNP